MANKLLAAIACVAALAAGPALASTTLVASQTTNLSSLNPDAACPNGDCTGGFLTVNYLGGQYNYGLLQFDLSSLSGPVTSALLEIYHVTNSGSADFALYQVTSAWDMNTATFNTAPTYDSTTPVATFNVPAVDNGGDLHAFDLTSMVNNWLSGTPNYGLALVRTDDANPSVYFASEDGGCCGGLAPALVIQAPAGGAPEPKRRGERSARRAHSAPGRPGCGSAPSARVFGVSRDGFFCRRFASNFTPVRR